MMNKILTIVIPTYNMEKYLDKCLTSLIVSDELMQLLEVLIINDGSKDRSSEIAHEYESRYPQTFRVIDKENGNYGSCINRGLKEATGEYIKILDADDSFTNNHFRDYLIFLTHCNADMVINNYDIIDETGKIREKIKYKLPLNSHFGWDLFRPFFRNRIPQMHSVAYQRKKLLDIQYKQTEGIPYTDQEWVFTPLATVEKIVFFDKPLYQYLVGRAGQTMDANVFLKNYHQNIICVKKIITDYDNLTSNYNLNCSYIKWKMNYSIVGIYYKYLVEHPTLNLDYLIDFDSWLQVTHYSLYLSLESTIATSIFPYPYIHKWRKNRKKHLPAIEIKIIGVAKKIDRLVKKLF